MASALELDAQLVLAFNGDEIQLVASAGHVVIDFPGQRLFDTLTSGPPGGSDSAKKPKSKGVNPLQQLHELVQALGLVLELRVKGKTHVTFGKGDSAKISFHAVLGKIGSFFRRD